MKQKLFALSLGFGALILVTQAHAEDMTQAHAEDMTQAYGAMQVQVPQASHLR